MNRLLFEPDEYRLSCQNKPEIVTEGPTPAALGPTTEKIVYRDLKQSE